MDEMVYIVNISLMMTIILIFFLLKNVSKSFSIFFPLLSIKSVCLHKMLSMYKQNHTALWYM